MHFLTQQAIEFHTNLKEQIKLQNSNEISVEQMFLKIASAISNKDEKVIQKVSRCLADTKSYFENHYAQYEERGIDHAEDGNFIQWIALVNSLLNHGHVCELDWKCEKVDFIYFLQKLTQAKTNEILLNENWFDEDDDIVEWCTLLDTKWTSKGMCVAALDIHSDSYVIFPFETANLAQIQKYAKKLGQRIDFAKNM